MRRVCVWNICDTSCFLTFSYSRFQLKIYRRLSVMLYGAESKTRVKNVLSQFDLVSRINVIVRIINISFFFYLKKILPIYKSTYVLFYIRNTIMFLFFFSRTLSNHIFFQKKNIDIIIMKKFTSSYIRKSQKNLYNKKKLYKSINLECNSRKFLLIIKITIDPTVPVVD